MVEQIKSRMTAAEFWQMTETTNQRFELIDGEAILMGTPTPDHQDVVLNSGILLKEIAKTQGGRVYVAPIEVYLDDANIPQPDVIWLAPDSQCKVTVSRLEGAPDLIVEVFSPSTRQHDRVSKFRLYQKHGVHEYWMIDPTAQYIEVWQHVAGKFEFFGVFKPGESFNSPVLKDQTISVQALFQG